MNKQEKLIYFLGQLKVYLENLPDHVQSNKVSIYDKFSELENFFNKSINDIFINISDNSEKILPKISNYHSD